MKLFSLLFIVGFLSSCNVKEKHEFNVSKYQSDFTINENGSLKGLRIKFSKDEQLNPTLLTISEAESPVFDPAKLNPIGPAVDIKLGELPTTLKENATVTIPLNKSVTNLPVIGYFNEQTKTWEYIGIDSYDSAQNTVTFQTNHFSIYQPMEMNIGGVENLLISIDATFKDVRPLLNKQELNDEERESLVKQLTKIKEDAYIAINEMQQDYDKCKERETCKYKYEKYEDLVEAMAGELTDIAAEETITNGVPIITEVVLKGVGGQDVVKATFGIGNLIMFGFDVAVYGDCILCFLPNSNISPTFWKNYLAYSWSKEKLSKLSSDSILSNFKCIDADGNIYQTIQIGRQVWMAENLRTTKYSDGNPIPNVSNNSEWSNLTSGAWSYYDNNSDYNNPYGKLYNWYTIEDPRNLCPSGWKVPSEEDWTELIEYLGGENVAGGKMKQQGTRYWEPPNKGATNESNFSAVGSGYRMPGMFGAIGQSVGFWSSTLGSIHSKSAVYYSLYFDEIKIIRNADIKGDGKIVRCVMSDSQESSLNTLEYTHHVQGVNTDISDPYLNVRSGPSAADQLIKKLPEGSKIKLIESGYGKNGQWSKIQYSQNSTDIGYVNKKYIRPLAGNNKSSTDINSDPNENIYKTIQIGNQVWMAENLNIPVPNSWCYDNNPNNCKKYGRLYSWSAACSVCPKGYRLPSIDEWKLLIKNPQFELFQKDFTAPLPGERGYDFNAMRKEAGKPPITKFAGVDSYVGYWSATPNNVATTQAFRVVYSLHTSKFMATFDERNSGVSVRCIKD